MGGFLTTQQLAKLCSVSENTVRNWAIKGSVPAIKMGPRVWRFPASMLEKLANEQLVGGASK